MIKIIRIAITLCIIFMVYVESGFFTAMSIFLITVHSELINLTIAEINTALKLIAARIK